MRPLGVITVKDVEPTVYGFRPKRVNDRRELMPSRLAVSLRCKSLVALTM